MRDLLSSHLLSFLLVDGTTSPPSDNTLKVALVTGAAAVVAAAITAIAATFQRSRPVAALLPTSQEDEDLESELRRRAESAEGQVATLNMRVAQLERYLYLAHIDPDTGAPL